MIRPLRQAEMLERAQGCLLGQLAGDALGSLVDFQTPEHIRREYSDGVRELTDGGTWNTVAGQPTDDSEMALLLARMLADQRRYDPDEQTLLNHKNLWVEEKQQHSAAVLPNLTDEEQSVYCGLKNHKWGLNVRLEQERINWSEDWNCVQKIRI